MRPYHEREQMTMHRMVLAAVVVLVTSPLGCQKQETASPQPSQSPLSEEGPVANTAESQAPLKSSENLMLKNDTLLIFEYLYSMGDALDCYFTVERMTSTATYSSPLDVADIQPEWVNSIDALVAKLNNDVTGLSATRSTEWPNVVHLVDDALGAVSGYAIEEEVTLEFSGIVDELIPRLGQELDGLIGPPRMSGIPPGEFWLVDGETEAEVAVTDEVVRNVLTGAVPLQNYNRVLWGATTYISNGSHHVEVSFGGAPWGED